MRTKTFLFIASLLALPSASAEDLKSWKGIHDTPLTKLEQQFAEPPVEFANHVIWGWQGNMDKKQICSDLDSIKSKGFKAVIFEAGYHLPFQYLSDEWFKAIRTGVLEAKKRGMKVWIIDEGKYPSGFAGGKFSKERPDLRMQALLIAETIEVKRGESLKDRKVPAEVISAVAVSSSGAPNRTVKIENETIHFTAGLDDWKILLVRSDFKTSVTRAVNNPKGGKDATNSLCDYLNPLAVKQFIAWTHEQYKKYLGKELGTTVLGFRGDEPDYGYMPWTPAIIQTFKDQKGYDPTPWLASFFTPLPTLQEQQVKADYWDVWSRMFAVNFFQQQADWCEENGVAHITHLNKDDHMPTCIKVSGDFFRTLSKVQIPGIDAIWNQIWPDTVNNFPKLAASVSHVYGKPRAFSESFAAYYTSPSIPQAKYVVDYQIARGINFFEFMFWPSGNKGNNWMSAPGMKGLNEYTNRTTYLMSQGKPGARIAMYYPTSTIWLGNKQVDEDITSLSQQLLTRQRDFDLVGDDAFTEALTIGPGYLENKSGQRYYTLIIPSSDVLSASAWTKIEEFAARGGKVLFWGRKPSSLYDKSLTTPIAIPSIPNAQYEPAVKFTARVEASLPEPEIRITSPGNDSIRYIRRITPDGDFFFLFNEGNQPARFTADFDKVGMVKEWNATNGTIKELDATVTHNRTRLEIELAPWESRLISIQKSTREYNVKDYGVKGNGEVETIALQHAINTASQQGGGIVVIPAGKYTSGALFFPRGVDLRVDKHAELFSTVHPDDFPVIPTRFEGVERLWRCAFLNFDSSDNVKVYGEGTIDGSGIQWKDIPFGTTGRPRLICFSNCSNGSISGLKLANQASWCLHILYTTGFTVKGLNIEALEYIPSSDGIDIDSSSDIHIDSTRIYAHDDCISIKSGRDADGRRVARPSENILIENCNLAFGHGGIAMGSEISGDIRNVTIRSCVIDKGNWNPLRFKSQPGRGGVVENITFEDITIHQARNIFDINMEWRMVPPLAPAHYPLTRLRNIRFKNIKGDAENIGNIYGFKDAPFTADSFSFENCQVKAKKGLEVSNAKEVNFEGLEMEVEQGEKIYERNQTKHFQKETYLP